MSPCFLWFTLSSNSKHLIVYIRISIGATRSVAVTNQEDEITARASHVINKKTSTRLGRIRLTGGGGGYRRRGRRRRGRRRGGSRHFGGGGQSYY